MKKSNVFFPAEWHQQRAIQLTWPKLESDWNYVFDEVEKCFVDIATAIAARQKLWIVTIEETRISKYFNDALLKNITFFNIDSNDTWARDHGGISVFIDGKPFIYDFCFNGWGMKFAADKDNLITREMAAMNVFEAAAIQNKNAFVLEGGSLESDGAGSLLTTELCLLSNNRNETYTKAEIEQQLKENFGSEQVLWLKNGYLAGDDTDSHIDTLARFIPDNKIAYVQCLDKTDEHFNALRWMEAELKEFKNTSGEQYELVALPMAQAVFDQEDGHRLPATYANFLIMNDTVLLPVYNLDTDAEALAIMKKAMPNYAIVPIDCSVLIRQHGSLHCVTMQYPEI